MGIRLKSYKDLTKAKPIKKTSLPGEVIIPLSQHVGQVCQPLVKVGDEVKTGTKIADHTQGLSSPLHASVSGKVKKIDLFPHPLHGVGLAVVIESDGRDEKGPSTERDIENIPPDEIRRIVREAGVVGLGGGGFPTHVKLTPAKDKPMDSFILNGAECEPHLTCDHSLMIVHPDEIVLGAKIIMRTVGARAGYIGIERNKQDAIKLMRERTEGEENLKVVPLPVEYPQGGEKQLIKTILGREVPAGGLPFDVGVLVHNVGTAFAVYEAVRFGKPLYERIVTVTGSCIREPQNLKVRIGTSFAQLIDECGGLIGQPAKVIMGGPMMGLAQPDLQTPTIKTTLGILLLAKDEVVPLTDQPCVRCGKCVEGCPMGLVPSQIGLAALKGNFELCRDYGILDCIECGICEYVCPGKRGLVQLIQFAKSQIT